MGIITGFLASLMGVGGGFIMVPAMIYLFRMGTVSAIGTSLFQIVFVTLNSSILQATYNLSVDLILAIFLLVGGVIGAQYGSKYTSKFKGEQLRVLLALIVILVCIKMGIQLLMSLQLTQGLLFKMHIRTSHIVKTLIIFSFLITNTAEADKLIFDVSNSKVTIGDKKDNDFTIYGFSDSKRTLVLKIAGPKQKVILQKKKKFWECGLGEKQENLVTQV